MMAESFRPIPRRRPDAPGVLLYLLICLDCVLMLIPRIRFKTVFALLRDIWQTRRPVESLIRFGYFTCRHFYARELSSAVGKYVRLVNDDNAYLNAGSYDYMGNGGRCRPEVMTATAEHGYGHAPAALVNELEKRLAAFVGKAEAIVCATGYSVNANLIRHFTGAGSVLIMDEQTHASIRVGASRAVLTFRHNDMGELERLLRHRTGRKEVWVFVEGLYSMEGDFCPLPELVRLRQQYGFKLYVDEAHSLGAVGPTGRGVCEYHGIGPDDVDVVIGTFSKSFASQGGFLATTGELATRIRNALTADPDPEMPITVPCAAQVLAVLEEGFRTDRLREISNRIRDGLCSRGFEVLGERDSPVIPVRILRPSAIVRTMERLTEARIALVLVGPPAVSWDKLRLRLCANASFTDQDVEALLAAMAGKARFTGRADPVAFEESDAAIEAIQRFGVGTCGPFQFYGTSTRHASFERFFAASSGYAQAIVYPSGYNMLHSVVGMLAGHGDAVLLPEHARGMLARAARESHAHVERYDGSSVVDRSRHLRGRYGRVLVLIAPGAEAGLPAWVQPCRDLGAELLLVAGNSGIQADSRAVSVTDTLAQLRAAAPIVQHAMLSFEESFGVTGGVYVTSADPYDHRVKSKSLVFSASLPVFCVEAVRARMTQSSEVS